MKKRLLAWLLIIALVIGESSTVYAGEAKATGEIEEQIDESEESGAEISEAEGDASEEESGENNKSDIIEHTQPPQGNESGEELQAAENVQATSASEVLVSGNYEYVINVVNSDYPKTVQIIKYLGKETVLDIPEEISGYRVATIGNGAFENCECLVEVKIPKSVFNIGNSAFRNCDNLKTLKVSDGLMFIGGYAFAECNSISGIELPNSIMRIEYGAFSHCSNLIKINIPDGVKIIEENMFNGCNNLAEVKIADSVTSIEHYAFSYCRNLTEINIPDSVTNIEHHAFLYCDNMTKVNIPSGVTNIDIGTFGNCGSLTEIKMPDSVTAIGDSAFFNCSSLTEINIPGGVTSIGVGAFFNCSSLTEINLPEGVTSIGNGAFRGCSTLIEINLPEGVMMDIGENALSYCSSLTKINLPEGVTSIGKRAFEYCSSLTEINLPEGVTGIGEGTFSYCSSLTEINLPEGVTSIGENAFSYCSSLTEINLPTGITNIGRYTFGYCSSLIKINLPEGVTSIGEGVFAGCSSLTEIKFEGDAPKMEYFLFDDVIATAYYPSGNSTWTDSVKQNYGGTITWKPWLPDEQKTTVSIAGKEEHYFSGQYNYETLSDLEKLDNGYSVLKGSTWNVTKTADLSDGILYIRKDANVEVTGNLRAGEIIVEKGGTLKVASGGKVTANTVTAKGGWLGDRWFGGNDSSGGKVEISGGLLVADNLNFEGRSTLHINNSGKAVARNSFCMATGSNGSSLEKGYVFIGGDLTVKNKNYCASGSEFGTVFYGNDTTDVLKASGKDFSLGMVYVVNSDIFWNLGIESKNYAGVAKCKVSEGTWNINGISKIADADASLSWAINTESAFTKMASSQSAFECVNSQLTKEERQFVEELAAVWVTVLQAPVCEGLLEIESADCTLDFQLDKGNKKCILRLKGTNFGGYGKLATVSLSVNGSAATTIGAVASASVDEFTKKAQEYLAESMKKEFIGYASGLGAGAIGAKTRISKDIVKKFIDKIAKKICVNEKIFNQTSTSSTTELNNRFKITEMLIKSSARITSADLSLYSQPGLLETFSDEKVIEDLPEPFTLSEVSSTVTDDWLKQRLVEILGKDADGEPDFSQAETITTLDLSEGYIQNLDGLQYFTNLKELNLADNEVQDLSPLAGLTKLEKLNVSGQFISNLSPISGLTNLTALDISDNELTTLSSIVRLTSLKELDASDNRLITLSSIGQLLGLNKLRISNNPLASENLAALKNLSGLSVLEANNCGLNGIEGLPIDSLTELYLSDNHVESLSVLSEAKKLSILDISYNLLSSAEELSDITTLTQLDISRNQLDSCEGLQSLTNLVSLYLAQTGLIDQDLDLLANLKKLQTLDISDNLIFGLGWRDSLEALKMVTVSNTALDDYDIDWLEGTGLTVVNHSTPIPLKSVSFINSEVTLRKGNRYLQEICCYPTEASLDGLVWSSNDEAVATVNEDGMVTAVTSGQSVITAETVDKEMSASFTVEVKGGTKGDLNADGDITMTDLLKCLHHVSGRTLLTGDAFFAADINDDGDVKMTDLLQILYYVSGRDMKL